MKDTTPDITTQYKIESGKPSWHQMRAGHLYAGSIIVTLRPAGLEKHIAALEKRKEPYRITKTTPWKTL
jgi:hypothetical protein